jgi:hypothetical protein
MTGAPEPFHERSRVGALSDEQRRAGMAEVVESQRGRGKSCPHRRWFEHATVEVRVAQRATLRGREHEGVRVLGSFGHVLGQLVTQD